MNSPFSGRRIRFFVLKYHFHHLAIHDEEIVLSVSGKNVILTLFWLLVLDDNGVIPKEPNTKTRETKLLNNLFPFCIPITQTCICLYKKMSLYDVHEIVSDQVILHIHAYTFKLHTY